MKSTISGLAAAMLLLAGCSYPEERYSSVPVYGDDVIASTSIPAPVYEPVTVSPPPVSPPARSADQELLTSIRHQFDRYGDLNGYLPNIDIGVRNGTVTLTGTVPGEMEKQMIDAMVRNTRGVVDVNNHLNVSDPRTVSVQPTGRAVETSRLYAESAGDIFNLHVESLNETDRTLAQRILSGLRTDTVLASSLPKVDIHIDNGAVVLQGNVQSELQRDTIAAAVQRAAGASPVRNELRVRPAR